MATYAAKTGTQNFSDTWALVDATSANITETSVTSFTNSTTSYVACTAFTPGAITIDGIGLHIAKTTAFQYPYTTYDNTAISGTFSVRLAQAGSTVTNTEVTVNAIELCPMTQPFSELTDKIGGTWVFFKFGSNVTLAAATAYTVDIKSSVSNSVQVTYGGTTSNWLRYLRTTDTTQNPAAGDRLFICGEINASSSWTTNTVNHNSTDSSTSYGRMDIGAYGEWIWNNAASTNYYYKTSGDIRLGTFGKIQIGTSASQMPSTSTATIDFVSGSGAGCTLFCARRSTITMHGAVKTHLAYLQSDTAAGATAATVSANSSGPVVDPGWKNGDNVTFSSFPNGSTTSYTGCDAVTLTADSSNGALQWTSSVNYNDVSQSGAWYAHKTYNPWVTNNTRNIKIKGASRTNTYQFTINTDLVSLTAVEMYFVDALHVRNGEAIDYVNIKNCVVRETRNVSISASAGGSGIILRGCVNITVEDCIVTRGGGLGVIRGPNHTGVEGHGNPALIKGCVSINNTYSNPTVYGMGNFQPNSNYEGTSYSLALFDSCVVTSNNYQFYYHAGSRYIDRTGVQNCHFGVNSYPPTFAGNYQTGGGATGDRSWGNGEGKITVKNCYFYSNPAAVYDYNVTFDSCTFTRNAQYSSDIYIQYNQSGIGYTFANEAFRITANNCTFNGTSSGWTTALTNFGLGYVVFNNCSTNTAANIGSQTLNGTTILNNLSCPNWTTWLTDNNASTDASPIPFAGGDWCKATLVKFQNFNRVEGDHRVYTGQYYSFSDSTIYDTSPTSIRVYSMNPTAGCKINKIRIPIKKNQSATLSVKVKLSEPAASYTTTKHSKSFLGKVPSLVIRANSSLGSNYDNDIEVFPSSQLNGEPNPSNFTPASLSSNLKLWLDCSSLSDITYNSSTKTVSQWNDKSGNGNHVTQSTESKKPLIRLDYNSHGGYPIALNRKLNQRLATSANILGGSCAESEVFIVSALRHTKENNGTSDGDVCGFGGASPISTYIQYSASTGAAQSYYSGIRGTNNSIVGYVGVADMAQVVDNIHLYHVRNSVANSQRRAFTNGIRSGTGQGSSPYNGQDAQAINVTPDNFVVGVPNEGSSTNVRNSAGVDIFEVVVVNKRMTDTEVDNMNKYLCNKWNIALRANTTSWKTLTYTLPSVSYNGVVDVFLNIRGSAGYGHFAQGWINIDSITVT